MNGLQFRRGLGVSASSRIDIALKGNWKLLRADLGIDDQCRKAGGMQFQVWGEDRLLYDSGLVKAPGVVKPELDVRGLSRLSLRTLGAQGDDPARVCGNWANAVLIGEEGDTGGKGWAYGVARYNGDRVEWYRVFSYSPRPPRVLERSAIEVAGDRAIAQTKMTISQRGMVDGGAVERCHEGNPEAGEIGGRRRRGGRIGLKGGSRRNEGHGLSLGKDA